MDFDETSDTPPPGWSAGQWRRLRRAVQQRDEAQAALTERDTKLSEVTGQVSTLQKQLATTRQDAVMQAAGGDFGHGDVRSLFRRAYQDHAADAGESAQPFDEWFASESVRSSPVLSRFFGTPPDDATPADKHEPPAQPPVQQRREPQPPPVDPNKDRVPAPRGSSSELTEKQLAEAARDPRRWSQVREDARKQLEERYGLFGRKT